MKAPGTHDIAIKLRPIFQPSRSPSNPDTPRAHEFCGPAFDAHGEPRRRRLRRLDGNLPLWSFLDDGLVQAGLLRSRNLLRARPRGLSGRFRIIFAGHLKRPLEILDIEP